MQDLRSERLHLRALRDTDWAVISFLRSDPQMNKYVIRFKAETKEQAAGFINNINARITAGSMYYWCISSTEDPGMIGSVSLRNFSAGAATAEIGYDLHTDWQGKGIMHEALSLVLRFGFSQLKLQKIEAYTHFENTSSRKMLEKHHFTLVEGKTGPGNLNNVVYATDNIFVNNRLA